MINLFLKYRHCYKDIEQTSTNQSINHLRETLQNENAEICSEALSSQHECVATLLKKTTEFVLELIKFDIKLDECLSQDK